MSARAEGRIELHVHLEGTVAWSTAAELARRHGLPQPPPYVYSDLAGFLQLYRLLNRSLVEPGDFERVVLEQAATMAAGGIAAAEISFNPGLHAGEDWLEGVVSGRRLARERFGVQIGWLVELDREASAAANRRALELALAVEGVVGLGLIGDEGVSAASLAPLVAAAQRRGLGFMPHAGQSAGPESVREALALGADRVAHGIASAGDPELLRDLAARGICLCVCPSSNRKLGLRPDYGILSRAGVLLCANTDDPAMVGTDLNRELDLLTAATGLNGEALTRTAWEHRFRGRSD